ncbi:MAG TPA: type I 3-dehydroquinate dehydratase [Chthoniobacterales bacterium]|nr:type I 3-dehydroquinate dehydratase [Chthoniobacterales bacterium]
MTAGRTVKARTAAVQLVGVISSPGDLQNAAGLRRPPDYFELRLDALHPFLPEAARFFGKLGGRLIITARHPAEAGMHNLSPGRRADLLLRYLPQARFVDIELRSVAELRAICEGARKRGVQRIISVHDFHKTPSRSELTKMLQAARRAHADIFKVVTRTDTQEDVARLVEFFSASRTQMPVAAMGTGRLGREARLELARLGSVLQYVHLGARHIEGQLSLAEMRRALA